MKNKYRIIWSPAGGFKCQIRYCWFPIMWCDMRMKSGWTAIFPNYVDAVEFIETKGKNDIVFEKSEKDNIHVMKGKLITYCGFTHSDKNHLTIEIWNNDNYICNHLKSGDEIEIVHSQK